jgi:hypothetical protein
MVALAGVSAAVFACWVRPRLMHWGATDEEVTGAYPGADPDRFPDLSNLTDALQVELALLTNETVDSNRPAN